eukprot:CAMPEP_0195587336 /NCGR_PEP_ID=MMETSP0814-20130614/30820_1 /TAXON_ID=97485 /ORGANISM="Prymnesium parvum, Strain Texoma1" /LENGTH=130 /DNA_ID=CAMNT_0040726083 /DNA_START=251 /DNA_END=640 /DNA_ORIENTATION=-
MAAIRAWQSSAWGSCPMLPPMEQSHIDVNTLLLFICIRPNVSNASNLGGGANLCVALIRRPTRKKAYVSRGFAWRKPLPPACYPSLLQLAASSITRDTRNIHTRRVSEEAVRLEYEPHVLAWHDGEVFQP